MRGGTVSFSAAGIDDTDPGGQLVFEAAYRRLGTASWESAYLSAPYWDSVRASFSFAPDFNASLGHYEFRLEAQDSHGGSSGWLLVPLHAEVINIPPQVLDPPLSRTRWSAPTGRCSSSAPPSATPTARSSSSSGSPAWDGVLSTNASSR